MVSTSIATTANRGKPRSHEKYVSQSASVRTLYTSADILRDARMKVCEAFASGGPESALAAVASNSIRLARWCISGELVWPVARKMLTQVSSNLKLVSHFGKGAVHVAINAGPDLYDAMSNEIEAAA